MTKMTKTAGKEVRSTKPTARMPVGVTTDHTFESKPVINYMNANSFTLDPLATLKMISASSIFGEPAYYESKDMRARNMEKAIDAALDYDFEGTLNWSGVLRNAYYMRLNPAIILTRAATHPKRVEFTDKFPGFFSMITEVIAKRPDDLTHMVEYYLSYFNDRKNGSKASRMPGILKRSIAKRLEQFNRYQLAKYANRGIGLVDVVRLTHAHNDLITELVKNGKIEVSIEDQTWRTLRSAGKSWMEILKSGITLSHSDLLFQMRAILSDIPQNERETARMVMEKFKSGVTKGMLFPYQYWIAYRTLNDNTFNHKQLALDTLQEAIDLAINAQPRLKGNVAVLVDNSGSARSGITFEGANTNIYEIGNLSGVMTAKNADYGVVGVFGDRLKMVDISHVVPALTQVERINQIGSTVGQGTENGIWLFWRDAIRNNTHWDTVFIYSDMQAGTGGLYGTNPSEYRDYTYNGGRYIDMWKLVDDYRKKVNRKVNVFSVQIAGYDNTIVPENKIRGANMTGWTGKESLYASTIIDLWDQLEG